ncbi:MAG: tetratricopeptide repeat protein [Pyrinomonadaceae bacterium]
MLANILYTNSGQEYHCGKRIGEGGEGEIYAVQDSPEFAIKLYFPNKLQDKEEKIREMARICPTSLRQFATFPLEPLYDKRKKFAGFLMDYVDGTKFHEFVSKDRYYKFPNARWNFFVRVAKNLARAVEALHKTGFVIGDINESNVFVLKDATVKIIDFDSSQFESSSGQRFLCEVGKTEYIPPELQDVSRKIWRTQNHDYFSLSVLIFQILFINRHPFTGIPIGDTPYTFKQAIKEHRFAFGNDSKSRGFLPPPNIIKLEEISKPIEENFRRAFLNNEGRPTAKQWIQLLENLEKNIKKCEENNGHFYPISISRCPWCRIEDESQGRVVHFEPLTFDSDFSLDDIWRQILSVPPPSNVFAFPERLFHKGDGWINFKDKFTGKIKLKVILFLALLLIHFTSLLFIQSVKFDIAIISIFGSAFICWIVTSIIFDSSNLFDVQLTKLEKTRSEYLNLNSFRAKRMQELEQHIREIREKEFLSGFRIADANIPQIGYSRTMTLRSFGVETAADISRYNIYSIKGFGVAYTSNLLAWKESIRSRFVFNPNQAITKADKLAVEREVQKHRVNLEKDLKKGKTLLEKTINGGRTNKIIAIIAVCYLLTSIIGATIFAVNQNSAIKSENIPSSNQNNNVGNLLVKNQATPEPSSSIMSNNTNAIPEDSEAMSNYKQGIVLTRAGKFREAVNCYETAVSLDAKFAQAYHELGYAYLRLGEYDKSIKASSKAVELRPKSVDTYKNLANAYQASNDLEKACESLGKAKSLAPGNSQIISSFNKCLIEQGNFDEAINSYKESIKSRPKNAVLHYELGKLYIKLGRSEEAMDEYSELLKLDATLAEKLAKELELNQ